MDLSPLILELGLLPCGDGCIDGGGIRAILEGGHGAVHLPGGLEGSLGGKLRERREEGTSCIYIYIGDKNVVAIF